jgi:hypothetical protein
MKKIFIGLAILLVVGIFYWYVNKESYTTTEKDEVSFAVTDVENIDRIVMRNRDGVGVDLQKKGDDWFVGDQKAFDKQVESLLNNTISRIAVRGPVASNFRKYVIGQMASQAIKVTIYSKGKKIKTYYVGEPDQHNRSTYMFLEGSDTPYETYIAGFEGFLTPRFHVIEDDWIDRILFDYTPEYLSQISINYYEDPESSFVLTRDGEEYFIDGKQIQSNIGKSYFSLYKYKGFEGYPTYLRDETIDSIAMSNPLLKIEVKDIDGNVNTLTMWYKGRDTDRTLYDKKGNVLAPDVERYFAISDKIDKMIVVQDYVFGKLLVAKQHFFEGKLLD